MGEAVLITVHQRLCVAPRAGKGIRKNEYTPDIAWQIEPIASKAR